MSLSEEDRKARIAAAVAAHDPGQHERLRLPWRDGAQLFPVISIELDTLVLNPRSHRIQAQLESDPEGEVVKRDPWSDEAQGVIARILRDIEGNFEDLATNLDEEGQQQPGVITATGLLVNANRRAVAMRASSATHIRVAVLPADATDAEIDRLELNLQMQQDFRERYTFTNRLLFVDELIGKQGLTVDQVARALNIAAGSSEKELAKGRVKVDRDTRVLARIRQIQQRSNGRLPLTSFDEQEIAFEELDGRLQEMGEDNQAARELFEVRLLGLLTDVPYRDLRRLDEQAIEARVMPLMLDNELLASIVAGLPAPDASRDAGGPTGLDVLEDEPDAPASEASGKVAAFNDLLARTHGQEQVVVSGDDETRRFDRPPVIEAVNKSLRAAAQELRDENRHDDQVQGPVLRIGEAERKVRLARDAFDEAVQRPDFDRDAFCAAVSRLRASVEELGDHADCASAD